MHEAYLLADSDVNTRHVVQVHPVLSTKGPEQEDLHAAASNVLMGMVSTARFQAQTPIILYKVALCWS